MALNKDEYYEEKWVGRKLLYRLHPAFDWREMPYDELCNKICDLENELKRVKAETSEREQANDNIPLVNNRTFIVTIECGEDTTDWKITAPNELAAKITASANYNRKRFNILRCVEYGC